MENESAPNSFARHRPARSASYSASLFDARNWNWRAYSIVMPLGDTSTRPAPHPCRLDAPSTCNAHRGGVGLVGGRMSGAVGARVKSEVKGSSMPPHADSVNSDMKSTTACSFIAVRASK
ncbi:unnamed protein product [Prunus armeniaca]